MPPVPAERLDPRYPEVRDYLLECCLRLVRDYDLDGLKLDFLDSLNPEHPESDAPGRDCAALMTGLERLLAAIREALTALNPEIIVEFRQHYTGPGMWKYGNVFRASDCAHDLLQNRVRTLDMRLLGGRTAVHSDMIIWSPEDTPQVAALQILNVLFSVPQISVTLHEQSEAHRKMLAFWMDFCARHRETLLKSPLYPEHPELSYPQATAVGEEEAITALYLSGQPVRLREKRHIVINATHAESCCWKRNPHTP